MPESFELIIVDLQDSRGHVKDGLRILHRVSIMASPSDCSSLEVSPVRIGVMEDPTFEGRGRTLIAHRVGGTTP